MCKSRIAPFLEERDGVCYFIRASGENGMLRSALADIMGQIGVHPNQRAYAFKIRDIREKISEINKFRRHADQKDENRIKENDL